MRPAPTGLALAALLVLAGCAGPAGTPESTPTDVSGPAETPPAATDAESPTPTATPTSGPTPTPEPTPTATPTPTPEPTPSLAAGQPRPDPEFDRVGWEDGRWHNESLVVDNSDGLNDSEFAAVLDRTMARVEVVRDEEFERDRTFRFLTREELLTETNATDAPRLPLRDLLWEAGFVVGENTTSAAALSDLYDVTFDGLAGNPALLVVEDPESPRIDRSVLAHELVHSTGLGGTNVEERSMEVPDNRDGLNVRQILFEGAAEWGDSRYDELCETRWECIEKPEGGLEVPDEPVTAGLYVDFAASYTLGERFMTRRYEELGDARAIDRAWDRKPLSTEEVIHPETYGNETPTLVTVANRNASDWRRMEPRFTRQSFGEMGLYAMLYHNGLVDAGPVEVTVSQQVDLNYSHPASAGWDGDLVAGYTNGSARGYVFTSVWDTERDAREFHEAYLRILDSKGATEVRDGVYRIPDGPYADAFRVTRNGTTLVVVNAPTVDALDAVHAPPDGDSGGDE